MSDIQVKKIRTSLETIALIIMAIGIVMICQFAQIVKLLERIGDAL